MTTLLLEPFGGLAGDMLLASLLDLEHPAFRLDDLRDLADALVPGGAGLVSEETRRGSLRARRLEVDAREPAPPHRHLADLFALVEASPLSPGARARAEATFRCIAEAEARVHGIGVDEVHFHEVGALDTLVDVCGAALAFERLAVEHAFATTPYAGGGTVRCAHGEMPVPAPGTTAVLGERAWIAGEGGERLTPTGAALLVTLFEEAPPALAFRARAVGYGAGHRDPDVGPPNLVRAQLGDVVAAPGRAGEAWLLELNLDDATGEEIGFLLERLRDAGALEAWSVPVQMKKDRPGQLVSALCRAADRRALEEAAFDHSPTLGVRWSVRERTECARETLTVSLEGESVRVKLRRRPGAAVGPQDLSPEFDDLARLARRTGRPLRALELEAVTVARRRLADGAAD